MKEENHVKNKSYLFAVSIINLYKDLKSKNEFDIARQILRSGTSIGANVEEAIGAYSRRDFLHKMTIAYKEARETNYWIRLLTNTGYLKETCSKPLLADVDELLKILGSIQITTKRKQGTKHQLYQLVIDC